MTFSTKLIIATEGLLVPKTAIVNRYGNPKVKLINTDEYVSVIILRESGNDLIVAENEKLLPGTELAKMEN